MLSTDRAVANRTVFSLVLLGFVLSFSFAHAALPIRLPDRWPACDAATLASANQAQILRIAEDSDALLVMNAQLSRGDIDKPWILYLIARNADVALGPDRFHQAIADHDLNALTGQTGPHKEVSADGWLLMQAAEHWLRCRYSTTEQELTRLQESRPGWAPVLNFMLWYCLQARLAPRSQIQNCVDAQIDDCIALKAVVGHLINFSWDEAENLAELRSFLALAPDEPCFRMQSALVDLNLTWLQSPPSPRVLAEQWRSFAEDFGDLAYGLADLFAYEIGSRLTYRQSLPLFEEFGRPRLGRAFRVRRAQELLTVGSEFEAAAVLAHIRKSNTATYHLRYRLATSLSSADTLDALLALIRRDIISTRNTRDIQNSYSMLGQKEVWKEVWAELDREYPARTISHRLARLTAENLPALQALRDSLQNLDLYTRQFDTSLKVIAAASATQIDVKAISAEPDPREREEKFYLAHITAEFRGDHALRDSLLLAEIKTTSDPVKVRQRAREGVLNGDRDLARTALKRLDELGDDSQAGLEFRVRVTKLLDGPAAAKAALTAVNVNLINSVRVLSDYAGMARYFKLPESLHAARNRLEALAPDSYSAKMVGVFDEQEMGNNGAAVAILRGLAKEYPGSQRITQKLMEAGDSVVALAALPTETVDRGDLFEPFGDDLDDLDQVRGRRVAEVDSFQTDVITLLSRRSVVVAGLDDAFERNRRIIQVLTRAGVDDWRSFTFGFDPSNGVPHVRVARVLTPDGKVLDTEPGSILVRAPEGTDSDVSDSREMVIPLRGVVPGSIIDVAYDMQNGSYLNNTWSMLEFFLSSSPVREYMFELQVPAVHPVYAVVHGDITTVPQDSVTGVRRWFVKDLQPVIEQDDRPSLTEVLPWVGLTTFTNWDAVAKTYGPHFWQGIDDSPRVAALADSLTRGLGSKKDKAAALYKFVVEEITPLAVELAVGRMVPSSSDEVLARGWGDCKDNSHLLIALLRAAGIEARPVLVSTVGHDDPRDDLPSLSFFDHMIVQITGIKGEPYCDPLNGGPCLGWLPSMSAGRRGLHLNPDGTSVLALVTPPAPEDHVSDLEVDVRPLGERSLRFDIRGRFTGDIADYMKRITAFGDTTTTRAFLDRSAGYGVPGGVPIRSWSVAEGACGDVEVAMTYLDTTWAEKGASSVSLKHRNEGSLYWNLPPSKGRLYDVVFPSTYTSHLTLRLHSNEVWTPADRMVPFSVENDFAHGTIKGKKSKEDGKQLLTITHEFVLTQREIPLDRYLDFRRDAMAFFMFSGQRYDFRRVLDKNLIKDTEKYAKMNPDDEGFRLNAAANLLGTDLGGFGEEGVPRREAAMDLLGPLVEGNNPNPLAAILVAGIHMKRGQYQIANQVINKALTVAADNLYLLSISASINTELQNWRVVADQLSILANKTGSAALIEQYVNALLILGDKEGAQEQLDRMRLLGSPLSEKDEAQMRFDIATRNEDLVEMKAQLARLDQGADDKARVDVGRCLILALEGRTAETIPLYESLLADQPGSSFFCNNLAWSYAICGQNLKRALMLSRVAMLIDDDPASSRNTYAVVLARMGEWKEAREIFRDIYENDDRPEERKTNGYFLGLAEAQLGHQDKAREIWNAIVDLPAHPKWNHAVSESLQALDNGGDLMAIMFEG